MATFKSADIAGKQPTISGCCAGEVYAVLASVAVSAALAEGDFIQGVKLPVGAKVVDLKVQATDIDTGSTPAIVMDFGVLNAAENDVAVTLIAGSTIGKAGGNDDVDAGKLDDLLGYAPDYVNERVVGAKVTTAAATAAAGTIYFSVLYAAA